MSLAEVFESVTAARRPYQQCDYSKIRDDLEPADVEFVEGLMADQRVKGVDIAATLAQHLGRKVPAEPIRRHRRGGCACESR